MLNHYKTIYKPKRLKFLLISISLWVLLSVSQNLMAQQPAPLDGYLLINTLEIGATENPNHLYHVDAANGTLQEILVEGQPVFARWFGWSPDGSQFAFIAPARTGINDELWLYRPDASNPQTLLLDLRLNAVSASWNPVFNIIAIGTVSERERDGIYLVNANTDDVVFVAEEAVNRTSYLDWSHDGRQLAYTDASGLLKLVDTTRRPFQLISMGIEPQRIGWTLDDRYYLFTDQIEQIISAIPTFAGAHPDVITPRDAETLDRFAMIPMGNFYLVWSEGVMIRQDLDQTNVNRFAVRPTGIPAAGYMVLGTDWVIYNDIQGQFQKCMVIDLVSNSDPQPIETFFGNPPWVHSRCQLLADGTALGLMASNNPTPFDEFEALYNLYTIPSDFSTTIWFTADYAGFDHAPLAYSPRYQQMVILEGDELVLYKAGGERRPLVSLSELGLSSEAAQLDFQWQP